MPVRRVPAHPTTLPIPVAIVASLAAGSACGGPMAAMEDSFAKGHYPEAKLQLIHVEPQTRSWESRDRAKYALYRGLTCEALGDRGQAIYWLRRARSIEDELPGSLNPLDAKRLRMGLDTAREISAPDGPSGEDG